VSSPARADKIRRRLPEFKAWLTANGAQVLEPTNEWEVLRFKANGITGIFYRNAKEAITSQGGAHEAWVAFSTGAPWRGSMTTKRRYSGSVIARSLAKRDGDLCFFCQLPTTDENWSVEHLVAATHNGPNHMSNFVLAHRGCNADAGHLSAMEKIRIHVAAVIAAKSQEPRA
jgi:hypothetical protein